MTIMTMKCIRDAARALATALPVAALTAMAAGAHDLHGIIAERTSLPPEAWAKIEEIRELRRYLAEEAAKTKAKGKSQDFEIESVVDTSALWPSKRVTVCFLDGRIDARLHVMQLARRWMEGTGLQLDFGPLDSPRSCDPANPSNIRVSFVGLGARSYVGREANKIAAALPTMVLGQKDKTIFSDDDNSTILHEFGHAIGLEHEHQSPASVCENEYNWDFLYRKFASWGYNRQTVDINMRQLPVSTRLATSTFDPESIMIYSLDRDIFRTDLPTLTCFVPKRNTVISRTDREAVATAYPAAISMRSLLPKKRSLSPPTRDEKVTRAIKRLKELTDAR